MISKEYIYPSFVDNTDFRYIKVDDKYIASIVIYDFPRYNSFLSILESFPKDIEYTMSIYIKKQDTYKILRELTNSISISKSEIKTAKGSQIDIDVIEKSQDDAAMLRKEIQINNQEIFYINFILTFYSDKDDELLKRLKRFQSKLYSNQIYSKIANFRHLDEYILSLPLVKCEHPLLKQNFRNFTTNSLCNLFFFYTRTIFDKNGVIFGKILSDNVICNIDMFKKSYLNSNMCILGSSGAGKSFFSKLLIIRHFMNGKKQYIFDIEGEYYNIVKKIGGNIFSFSNNHLNILEITDYEIMEYRGEVFKFKLKEVVNFLCNILNITDDVNEKELENCILNVYKKFDIDFDIKSLYIKEKNKIYLNNVIRSCNDFPTLNDLEIELKSDLLKMKFIEARKKYPFLFGVTDVDFGSMLTLFDLSNVSLFDTCKIIKYILEKIILKLKVHSFDKNQVDNLIYIDEVWKYVTYSNDNIFLKYIFELFKTIRKLNAGIVIITQDISDLFNKKNINYGKSILNNCFFKVVFKLDFNDVNVLSKISGINNEILEDIKLLNKGEAMVTFNNNNTRILIEATNYEKELIEGDNNKNISGFK